MLLVATLSLDPTTMPAQYRPTVARRAVATITRLARQHELVIVADWPDRGWTVRSLVDALAAALPWHEIVLVAARTDTHGRHAGGIGNVPTIRRLVDDGAVVICLAGGPGRDRIEPVAVALAEALRADRMVRLTGEILTAPDRRHDVRITRGGPAARRRTQHTVADAEATWASDATAPSTPQARTSQARTSQTRTSQTRTSQTRTPIVGSTPAGRTTPPARKIRVRTPQARTAPG